MAGVKAPWGQRGIQVVVDFWTDSIAEEGPGFIEPKVAWGSGAVSLRARKVHGIGASEAVPFNSLDELPATIARVSDRAGVTLRPPVPSRRVS
jgi:hypothetical protein